MSSPTVSVIIPVYNRARLVREAVESVRAQTFGDFELIVVDDGSTDETPAVLAEIAASTPDGRLRVRRIAHDGHPGAVRNRAAEQARGRYLAFLDADDLWRPQKLELQLALHGSARISHTRELWLRNGREISQRGMNHAREGEVFADALGKCTIGPSTVILERRLFEESGGFREDLEIAEDYELWLRITAREQVAYLDEPLTVKRAGHGDQLSEKYGQIEVFRIAALRDLVRGGFFDRVDAELRADHGPARSAPARTELARKCRIYAAGCEKRGRHTEAAAYRAEAAEYDGGAGG
jgi:hypothetical protein